MAGEKRMAISTVSKFSGPNTDITGSIFRRLFGHPIPDGVLHVDLQDDTNSGNKVVRWITATGKHSMPINGENMEDSLTSVLVTMRMTC